MKNQELRDGNRKLLGIIKTLGSGILELRDSHSKLLGTYDPKSNETRDPSRRLIGRGNLLTTLLK